MSYKTFLVEVEKINQRMVLNMPAEQFPRQEFDVAGILMGGKLKHAIWLLILESNHF